MTRSQVSANQELTSYFREQSVAFNDVWNSGKLLTFPQLFPRNHPRMDWLNRSCMRSKLQFNSHVRFWCYSPVRTPSGASRHQSARNCVTPLPSTSTTPGRYPLAHTASDGFAPLSVRHCPTLPDLPRYLCVQRKTCRQTEKHCKNLRATAAGVRCLTTPYHRPYCWLQRK